jgi:diguanylate cyclase (GGDEF)-like protein
MAVTRTEADTRSRAAGGTAAPAIRIDQIRRRLEAIPVAVRLGLFTASLAIGAVLIFVAFLIGRPPVLANLAVPWPVMAVAFFAAEIKVVVVHWRRERHSYSLSELPAVMSFFLLTPEEYFLALLVGSGAALLAGRMSPIKAVFNLAHFAFTAAVALTVFHSLIALGPITGPWAWLSAFCATLTTAILSSFSIATVISISGGAPQFEKLPEMIQFGALVAVANTSLGLLAVALMRLEPQLLALLVVPLLTVFLAYGAYVSEREKHQRLELLYQSSRILQHSPELDSALAALLEHAREMFLAERAEILLWPKGEGDDGLLTSCAADGSASGMVPTPVSRIGRLHRRVAAERKAFLEVSSRVGPDRIRNAMATPLLGESGLIGSIVIANRLTAGTTFGQDDLRLLETLANQSAVALENGQLEQSLTELSRLKEQLRYQAYHDPLTALANRSLFVEQVDEALERPSNGQIPVVLFLDLDNFKDVNDTLGHAAGDRLLVAVADRVRSCVRSGDLAARLGGDEFAILLYDDPDLAASVMVATRLIDAMGMTVPVEGQDLLVTASIGIAANQGSIGRADELLRNADVAMYTAKQAGKNRFAVFESTMHAAIVARHALSNELTRGISADQIDVFYQPIMSLAAGEIAGVEALARWHHPTRGLIGPEEFIPLAEESGAILALGRDVLVRACRDAAPWSNDRGEPLTLTVNLAAAQLQHEGFVADLEEILRTTGFPGSRLVLELTETAMFHDTQTTIARLASLRDLGIRIAVDDFGTGYSSLGYLRRFQVDILKIAREFVAPGEAGPGGWAFAHAIVALGRTLGLRIIAEGVEDDEQLRRLRELGCELGQGFLFARPMPAPAMEAMLERPPSRFRPTAQWPAPVAGQAAARKTA